MTFIRNETARDLHPDDMRRMGVGKRFWHVSVDQIPETAHYRKELDRYLQNLEENVRSGVGMMFYGDYRKGKTSSAVILAKAVVAYGGTSYFIRSDDLVSSVLEKKEFDQDQTVMQRLDTVDLLVVDDLGAEHTGKSHFNVALLEKIVRYRYDNRKALVLTVNLSPKNLVEVYGEGTLKVIKSMMRVVEVDGTNWYEQEVSSIKPR